MRSVAGRITLMRPPEESADQVGNAVATITESAVSRPSVSASHEPGRAGASRTAPPPTAPRLVLSGTTAAFWIEDQVRLCREFVSRRGGEIVEIFTHYAISGSSLKKPHGCRAVARGRASRPLRHRGRRVARPALTGPGGRRRHLQAAALLRGGDRDGG